MTILYLTHRLPFAPNRGDRIRAYYMLREMSRFASVHLLSLVHDDEEATHVGHVPFATDVVPARVPRLRNLLRGAASMMSQRPLTHSLLDVPNIQRKLDRMVHRAQPDVVVALCSGMARFALAAPLSHLPLVVDFIDVDSAKWRDLAAAAHGPRRWLLQRETRTLGRFEAMAAMQARRALVVNERERGELVRLAPAAPVLVVENGIELAEFAAPSPPSASQTVIFCGVMNYEPNESGVRWFAERVWPIISAEYPGARFVIVGSGPTPALNALAVRDSSITVTGSVPAVQPYLWKSAVSVAPLHLSRGVQNKVLEALAAGLPVVVTPSVYEGLPAEARPGCVAAQSAEDFGKAVLRLLALSPEKRRSVAKAAELEGLGWTNRLAPLESILRQASAPQTD